MATKKTSKGVLGQIGDAVAAGTEAVIEAGASAVSAVGHLLPGAPAPSQESGTPPKKAAKRTAAKKKAPAKTAKPKGTAAKKVASAKGKAPKAKKAAKSTKPKAPKKKGAKAKKR